MKYHKQKFLHEPEIGQYGDCYRTCIACILDMELDDVPHFLEGNPPYEVFNSRIDEFLHKHGLKRFIVGLTWNIEGLLHWMKVANPDTLYFIAATVDWQNNANLGRDADRAPMDYVGSVGGRS